MCGVAGLFSPARVEPELLSRMAGSMAHRGPDDEGMWIDDEAGIGLAHRRLSVLDRSRQGHQPMHSADGRFVICFNGEIYNHAEIRAELEAIDRGPEGGWQGHSDTEILLQAIAVWGLEQAINKSVGMFAMAVWDRKERLLHLARDRFGEKPLYYAWAGRDLVFGSELNALRCHPRFDRSINRQALKAFAARTYIPAPLSIYRGTYKLPSATILTMRTADLTQPFAASPEDGSRDCIRLSHYWSYRQVVREGLADQINSESDALEALEQVLAAAIKGQSVADVPVGALLSGGIDSSTIVALYQKHTSQSVRTYSIGFEEAGFNEAEYAKRVAAYLGTEHHEHYVTVKDAVNIIPLLPAMYGEPFADSSQIPTFLVSRFARRDVTVALTGDGGDELFGGYNRHIIAPQLWRRLRQLPRPIRALAASPATRVPASFWAKLFDSPSRPFTGAKIQKGLRIARTATNVDDVYQSFLDEWSLEESPVLAAEGLDCSFDLDIGGEASDAIRMMYCDAVSYLPDEILTKVDRASMAVSLETRLPFLDHRVAALVARIPIGMKIRNGQGKHLLRQLLFRQAPRELFERPKAGFAVPVGEWIKSSLRPWAEELFDAARMAEDGWLNPVIVHQRWADHLAGRKDSTHALWAILMFQAWLREQETGAAPAAACHH